MPRRVPASVVTVIEEGLLPAKYLARAETEAEIEDYLDLLIMVPMSYFDERKQKGGLDQKELDSTFLTVRHLLAVVDGGAECLMKGKMAVRERVQALDALAKEMNQKVDSYLFTQARLSRLWDAKAPARTFAVPSIICPSCQMPYDAAPRRMEEMNLSCKYQLRTPAHNIISRDALKTADCLRVDLNQKVNGAARMEICPELSTFAHLLVAEIALVCSQGFATGKQPRLLFREHASQRAGESAEKIVRSLLNDERVRKFIRCKSAGYGELLRLFCKCEVSDTESLWEATSKDKIDNQAIVTAMAAVQGLFPSDAMSSYFCQSGDGAQCEVCEWHQAEVCLLARYHWVKGYTSKVKRAEHFRQFIGLQFCRTEEGARTEAIDSISETFITEQSIWQTKRHLNGVLAQLFTRAPPFAKVLVANWKIFEVFYHLAFIKAGSGTYRADGFYFGEISDNATSALKLFLP